MTFSVCRPPGSGSASDRIHKDQKASKYMEWKIWKNVDPNSWNCKKMLEFCCHFMPPEKLVVRLEVALFCRQILSSSFS